MSYPLLLSPGTKSTTGIPALDSSIVSSKAEKLSARILPSTSPVDDRRDPDGESREGEGARLEAGVDTVEVTEMTETEERWVDR